MAAAAAPRQSSLGATRRWPNLLGVTPRCSPPGAHYQYRAAVHIPGRTKPPQDPPTRQLCPDRTGPGGFSDASPGRDRAESVRVLQKQPRPDSPPRLPTPRILYAGFEAAAVSIDPFWSPSRRRRRPSALPTPPTPGPLATSKLKDSDQVPLVDPQCGARRPSGQPAGTGGAKSVVLQCGECSEGERDFAFRYQRTCSKRLRK